jgi:hypothetical protein
VARFCIKRLQNPESDSRVGQHRIEICGVKSSRRPGHTKGCSAKEEEEEEEEF